MKMLEKMARAMCVLESGNWNAASCMETLGGSEPEDMRQGYLDLARAALEAVREADDLMLKAAFAEMNRTSGRTWKQMKAGNATPREMFDAKERPRFTAMIDAILGGEA